MSLTLGSIDRAIKSEHFRLHGSGDNETPEYRALEVEAARQRAIETELARLIEPSACGSTEILATRANFSHIDPGSTVQLLRDRFFDASVMEAATCITSAVTGTYRSTNLETHQRIRHWFTDVMRIGADSSNGIALKGDLDVPNGELDDFFVAKTMQDADSETQRSDLIHESIVGHFGLNPLRRLGIPNFMYTYGMFACSSPLLGGARGRQVLNWCQRSSHQFDYLLVENVPTKGTLKDAIVSGPEQCTVTHFWSYFLQVLFSLRAALQYCHFTHYDLHDENVLIRTVDRSPIFLRYDGPMGKSYWLRSPGVATIIDYGSSHIRIPILLEGKRQEYDFGHPDSPYFQHLGIYRDRENPFGDIYKLLMYCLSSASGKNIPVYRSLRKAAKFFVEDSEISELLRTQLSNYYSLPFVGELQDKTIDDFIEFVMNVAGSDLDGVLVMPRDRDHTLQCGRDYCFTSPMDSLQAMGISAEPGTIDTYYQLIDMVTANSSQREDIRKRFNEARAYRLEKVALDRLIQTTRWNIVVPVLSQDLGYYLTPKYHQAIKLFVDQTVLALNSVETLRTADQVLRAARKEVPESHLIVELQDTISRYLHKHSQDIRVLQQKLAELYSRFFRRDHRRTPLGSKVRDRSNTRERSKSQLSVQSMAEWYEHTIPSLRSFIG